MKQHLGEPRKPCVMLPPMPTMAHAQPLPPQSDFPPASPRKAYPWQQEVATQGAGACCALDHPALPPPGYSDPPPSICKWLSISTEPLKFKVGFDSILIITRQIKDIFLLFFLCYSAKRHPAVRFYRLLLLPQCLLRRELLQPQRFHVSC